MTQLSLSDYLQIQLFNHNFGVIYFPIGAMIFCDKCQFVLWDKDIPCQVRRRLGVFGTQNCRQVIKSTVRQVVKLSSRLVRYLS